MPVHVGIGSGTLGTSTTVVVPLPAGSAVGDGIELFAFCEGPTRTANNSQGMTKAGQVALSGSHVISCWYKILVAADVTRGSFSITHTGGGTPAFANGFSRGVRGITSGAPVVSMESAYDTAATSHNANAVTTTAPGAFVSVLAMDANGTMTFTPPSGWTEDDDAAGHAWFHVLKATAGSTGAINFSTAASGQIVCCTFAWHPTAVTGAFRSSTRSLTTGTVGLTVAGATRSSTLALQAPALLVPIAGATRPSTLTLAAGTVALAVAGAARASAFSALAGTLTLDVAGATRASTLTIYAGTAQPIVGAHRASALVLPAGMVTLGLVGASRPSTLVLQPGRAAHAVGLGGGTRASAFSAPSGTVSLTLGGAARSSSFAAAAGAVGVGVTGATRPSTLVLTPGQIGGRIEGAVRTSTLTLAAGTVGLTVAGTARSSTLSLTAGHVALDAAGATRASTLTLYPGTVIPGDGIAGSIRSSTLTLTAGAVVLVVAGATRPSSLQVFAGARGRGHADDWFVFHGRAR